MQFALLCDKADKYGCKTPFSCSLLGEPREHIYTVIICIYIYILKLSSIIYIYILSKMYYMYGKTKRALLVCLLDFRWLCAAHRRATKGRSFDRYTLYTFSLIMMMSCRALCVCVWLITITCKQTHTHTNKVLYSVCVCLVCYLRNIKCIPFWPLLVWRSSVYVDVFAVPIIYIRRIQLLCYYNYYFFNY